MQYGIFSDIHGNLAALKAVWEALETASLTERPVLNAGDNVGYGPDPEACVQFLRACPNIVTVKGNYDKNVALFPEREAEYRKKWGRLRPDKFEALREGSSAISEESRHWLHDLPSEADLTLDTVPIFLTHYAPSSKEGLGTWTPSAHLAELAANTEAKVVVCGHTHTPFVRVAGGILWVNPGSLGRSWDGKYRFAILTLEPGLPPSAELKIAR
ncbi:MAG: metallophosphoesterase family protein [Janthinobacterium lividum]